MPEVGLDGQRRLKAGSVLCVGLGGLGSPAAMYLAAAGVGRIGLIDADVVDYSNLQRQILHSTKDVGRKKLNSARESLQALNPDIHIAPHPGMLTVENAMETAEAYDILLDGSDNFATRYLANDVAFLLGKPYVYGSIYRFDGQASVFAPQLAGGCYRCMMPQPPPVNAVPSCAEGGVLGVLPGLVGTIQATEAVKLLLGIGNTLAGRLLRIDALGMRISEIELRQDPECPLCGNKPTITDLSADAYCNDSRVRNKNSTLSAEDLQLAIKQSATLQIIDVREYSENREHKIAQARALPASDLPASLHQLDPAADIVLVCNNGLRSEAALGLLTKAGFANVRHLEGGLNTFFAH